MAAQGTDLLVVERAGVAYKATAAELAALGGGGGGATWQRVFLDVPAGQARFKKVNLVAAAVTPASVVVCQFFGGTGAAVNEADEVAKWTISATPLTGSIDFNISCRGPFVGAVEILYKVQ